MAHTHTKKDKIMQFAETWGDLETVLLSEVSQNEKNKQSILMHICGIQKNGIDDFICKAEIDIKVENNYMDTKEERWGMEEIGKLGLTHMYY